jgi:hypothetical protein
MGKETAKAAEYKSTWLSDDLVVTPLFLGL